MLVKSFDDPLFERVHSTLSQALIGHNETVDLLSRGKLKLSHIRRGAKMPNQGVRSDRPAARTYFKALDTSEGQVRVLTKTRWMGFIPMPHTSVTPHGAADLKRLGTFIKWSTISRKATWQVVSHLSKIFLVFTPIFSD